LPENPAFRQDCRGVAVAVLAELLEPPVRVLAAITARRPASTTDGEVDFSTGLIKFLGNLCARLAASYYQHGARHWGKMTSDGEADEGV